MVEQSFDGTKGSINKNVSLAEEFNCYLKNAIAELETKAVEQMDSDNQLLWVKLSALYVLNYNLFGTVDKKLFKQLWDLNKKVSWKYFYLFNTVPTSEHNICTLYLQGCI